MKNYDWRKTLEFIFTGLAVAFAVTAVGLAFLPGLIAIGLGKVAEDLSGEWRRGREQNWLWRWARNKKSDRPGVQDRIG